MLNLVRILAGIGVVTVLLAVLKRMNERRCWRRFKRLVDGWVIDQIEGSSSHPRELNEDEWQAACERMLDDAGFGPIDIEQLLDLSIVVAKGIVADRVFM